MQEIGCILQKKNRTGQGWHPLSTLETAGRVAHITLQFSNYALILICRTSSTAVVDGIEVFYFIAIFYYYCICRTPWMRDRHNEMSLICTGQQSRERIFAFGRNLNSGSQYINVSRTSVRVPETKHGVA
jgi:hypothetical protein